MTRPPHAASSVVGYASDTASAVAKVEPNSNRSRETGRPYCYSFWVTVGGEVHWGDLYIFTWEKIRNQNSAERIKVTAIQVLS